MRVAIGGISHESSTFSAVPPALEDFAQRALAEGPALLKQYAGTRTCPGGFIDGDLETPRAVRRAAGAGGRGGPAGHGRAGRAGRAG